MITLVIVLVVLVALVLFGISAFNRLRTLDVKAQEALGGIDVQLTRRADLIPNLVETVKGYAAHEKGVFEEVTAARAAVTKAAASGTVEDRATASAALDASLVNVMAVAENYPDLKASTNFLDLQRQLTDTENQLSFARQYYNDAVVEPQHRGRHHPDEPVRRGRRGRQARLLRRTCRSDHAAAGVVLADDP